MDPVARVGRWIAALLLATAVVASCGRDVLTAKEVMDACHKDPGSKCCDPSDCPQGSFCDFSVACAQGADRQVSCDPGRGDRQCHVSCTPATPCAAGQTCETKALAVFSDVGVEVSFCVAF